MKVLPTNRLLKFGIAIALTLMASVFSNRADASAVLQPSTTVDVSGGAFTNPGGYSTTGSQSTNSAGFSVGGDFSVTASGTDDIVITITTDYLLTFIEPGLYATSSSIDGRFSSSIFDSTAYVYGYDNVVSLLDSSSTPVGGSFAFAGGQGFPSDFAPFAGGAGNHLTSAGQSGPFFAGGLSYTLHAVSTIDITGVQAGETISIDLPNGSGLGTAVPEPSSFALLGLGVLGAGLAAYRRKNVIA